MFTLVYVVMAPDPTPFDGILSELGTFAPAVVIGLGAVVALALSVALIKWGVPQLLGFFKRLAK